jgi:hypothetical protein
MSPLLLLGSMSVPWLLVLACFTVVNSSKIIDDYPPKQILPAFKIPDHNTCASCIVQYRGNLYPKNVFYHLHIPKTGGTTFLGCLKCWDKDALTYVASASSGWQCPGINIPELKEGVKKNKTHVVSCEISGEGGQLNSFLRAFNTPSVRILTFIRNPIDHVFSALMHYKAAAKRKNACATFDAVFASDTPGSKSTKCEHYPMRNMQTTALSPASPKGAANLSEAVTFISKNVFHFGITSYYRASLCLLAYQLGQLNMQKSSCDCSKTVIDVKHSNDNSKKKLPGQEGVTGMEVLSPDSQKILETEYINLDNVLYHVALQLFLQRVLIAERESGMPLLCPATDGVEITALKDSISEPRWYNSQHRGM